MLSFNGNRINTRLAFLLLNARKLSTSTSELKSTLAERFPKEHERIRNFRKTHGKSVVDEITLNRIYDGMLGLNAMICETSELNLEEGVYFRGHSIHDCLQRLPKAKDGSQPLPEAVFWLLLTGNMPSDAQAAAVSAEWAQRSAIPEHIPKMIKNLPTSLSPIVQFSAAITALNTESVFVKAYGEGIRKQVFWEYVYEDAMNVIAKLPTLAAAVYSNAYREGKRFGSIDPNKDWCSNIAYMMGLDRPDFIDFLRLYMVIHSDHDGGSIPSHSVTLVGSTLSDAYLALAAGMNGIAGPLNGQIREQAVLFLNKMQKELGDNVTDEQVKEFVLKTLKTGQTVPAYGHLLLKLTDPRFTCLHDYALKHFPNDPQTKLASQLFKVAPDILRETGKVQYPWPTVDAISGMLLQNYGVKEIYFHNVLFGMSRALGSMAALIWARGLGIPIERPKSASTIFYMKKLKAI